jgi:hypothetical protein
MFREEWLAQPIKKLLRGLRIPVIKLAIVDWPFRRMPAIRPPVAQSADSIRRSFYKPNRADVRQAGEHRRRRGRWIRD